MPWGFGELRAQQFDLLLEKRSTATQFPLVGVLVRAARIAWLKCHAVTSMLMVSSQRLTLHRAALPAG
jgi:hypothetical protein